MNTSTFAQHDVPWWRANEFDITQHCLYLDHAALSPLPNRVAQSVAGFNRWRAEYGSRFDVWWEQAESVRQQIGALVGSSAENIAFVQNTSSGLNLVAQGLEIAQGSNIIVCDIEFPSNIYPWTHLESKGVEVRWLRAKDGQVLAPDLEQLMDERTAVVSLSFVESGNGFKTDIAAVSKLCRRNGTVFVVDAIQGLGVHPIDVQAMGIDVLVSGFFKWLFGPDGIAFVYCSDALLQRITPAYVGWAGMKNKFDYTDLTFRLDGSARKFETGNLNFSALHGVEAALQMVSDIGVDVIHRQVMSITSHLLEGLKRIPTIRCLSDFSEENRSQIVLVECPDSRFVHARLKEQNVVTNYRNGLRISPHFYNTFDDIDRLLDHLEHAVAEVAAL